MNKKNLSLLLVATCLSTGLAHAEQTTNPSWYVVPQAGALFPDGKVDADTGWFGGIKLGKPVNSNLDIQVGLTYGEADEYAPLFTEGKYKQTLLSVEALYLFGQNAFRPFLSLGLGAAHDQLNYTGPSINADRSKYSLMGSLGAGIQYAWSKNTFLQADVRYVRSIPTTDGSGPYEFSGLNNIYAGLGVGFHFGNAPEPAPKAAPAPVVVAPAAPKTCEELGNCKKVEAPKVEVAPVVEAKPVPPAPKYEVVENNLRADGTFATGSGKLTKQGQTQIDAAIAAAGTSYASLSKTEGLELEVVGHADRTGKADVNQKLSEQRAEAVKAYLVSKGLSADSIKTAGRGSSQPVTKPEDCKNLKGKKLSVCLAADRRIELHGKATRVVKVQ